VTDYFKGIDLEQLEVVMTGMNRRQRIYQLIRRILKARGNWKDKPRGNPNKGYKARQ